MTAPDPDRALQDGFSWRGLVGSPTGHLAMALLAVELIAGMQTFLLGTITPLLAADLHGQHLYGVVTAATQVSLFLTMPLGAGLMQRWSPARLLAVFTPVTVLAGVLAALAPSMWAFIGARVLGGLAAGVLATVGMGAIVTGLPPAWRQVVLAANNLMWLISSVVGPAYAGWVAHALSWRWALVLYLPFLVLARWVIARRLPHQPSTEARSKLPLGWAVLLAAGIAAMTLSSTGSWWGWVAAAVGVAGTGLALVRLLPSGVLSARPGARAAVGLLGLLSILVFATDAVAAILAHDVLGMDAAGIAVLLTVMSFCWSAVGLWCARRPATGAHFLRRGGVGVLLLGAGIVGMAVTFALREPAPYVAAFAVVGLGMGLVFLDAMNVCFTPDPVDPLDPTVAASASVLSQQVLGASAMTLATSVVALDRTWGTWVLAAIAVVTFPTLALLRRAAVVLR